MAVLDQEKMSDESLMWAYKQGDVCAFECLYHRYAMVLHNILLCRTSFKEIEVEEISQEVWLAVARAAFRYEVSAKFSTYLYTIVKNKMNDFYRKKKYSKSYQLIYDYDFEDGSDDCFKYAILTPEQLYLKTEAQLYVLHAMQKLPLHHREVLLYRYQEELTVPEIAILLKMPLERVKSKLRYAKKALQQLLLNYEIEAF